jgi:LexA DNA binding domain
MRLPWAIKPDNIAMRKRLEPDVLTSQLAGREISHLSADDEQHLSIHFSDGAVLRIESGERGMAATVSHRSPDQPTKRQSEYLRFINKYIHQFGRAPAESDIQRHFLVSAPSVNQMMQTLERRGFITRQPGVPRSIRLCGVVLG